MSAKSNWKDLGPRLVSAIVLVAIGAVSIVLGGPFYLALIAVVTGLMVWELLHMLSPKDRATPIWMGLLAAAVLAGVGFLPPEAKLPVLLAPVIVGYSSLKQHRKLWVGYMPVIMLGGYSALMLRVEFGVFWVLWLVSIVVASDVLGYFAGRLFGGPKFWPRISPKKTWSGTVAGWVGAGLVGYWFMDQSDAEAVLIVISVVVAFAAQLGDIAESAIKRTTGVKDSSNLIPGHGGFLDRFDGMLGALLLVLIAGSVTNFLPGVQ